MKRNLLTKQFALMMAAVTVAVGDVGAATTVLAFASDKKVEQSYLGQPAHVWWETATTGKWNSVSKAKEYQVKLYIADDIDLDEENWQTIDWDHDELEAVMTKRTTEQSCDFSEYMDDLHSYFFVVRATPKLNEQAYVTAGNWVASPGIDFRGKQVQGITDGKWRNYLEGTMYENLEQDVLKDGWYLIKGDWYLFDRDGYVQTGWQNVGDARYYLGNKGAMATGWFVYEENWYYADNDGAMKAGWIMDLPGQYYYLYEDGTMAHDVEIEGYWLDSSGLRN